MSFLVSVIIPTYNGSRYIRATLNSVVAQTYRPLEIIVVDDGSTDATADVVASVTYPIKVLRQNNLGHPAARNAGIAAASGEFLSFLDHDDLWMPDKTAWQLECFAADPQLDLVFGHIQNFLTEEMSEEDRLRIASPMHALPGLLQGAMMARRSSFDRVGAFSLAQPMGDFLEWYGRASVLGLATHMQPETVLRRRIHSSNFTRTHRHLRQHYLPVLKQLMDRRRGLIADANEKERE